MADTFNRYHEWLGLDATISEPNSYQLLGLEELESDIGKIAHAAERAMSRVRGFRPGAHASQWSELLDELLGAKECLLDPARKAAYDKWLQKNRAAEPAASAPQIEARRPTPDENPNLFPPGMGAAASAAKAADVNQSASTPSPAQPIPLTPATPAQPASPNSWPSTSPAPEQSMLPPGAHALTPSAPQWAPAPGAPYQPAAPQPAAPQFPPAPLASSDPMAPVAATYAPQPAQAPMAQPVALTQQPAGAGPATPPAPVGDIPVGDIPVGRAVGAAPAGPPGPAVIGGKPTATAKSRAHARRGMQTPLLVGIGVGVLLVMSTVLIVALNRPNDAAAENNTSQVARATNAGPSNANATTTIADAESASAPDSVAPDSAAPDSAAPDSAAPDSAAPDSAAPNADPSESSPATGTPGDGDPATGQAAPNAGSATGESATGESATGAAPSAGEPAALPPNAAMNENAVAPTSATPQPPATAPANPFTDPATTPTPDSVEPPEPLTPPSTTPNTPTVPNSPPDTPAPEPVPTAQPTPQELAELAELLPAVQAAIAEQNFAIAEAELAKAQSLAKLDEHKAMVNRLKLLNEYVRQFRQALEKAIAKLDAGESFTVGTSTQVGFVESLPGRIIVRVAGRNRNYALSELPAGLAVAIADLALDQSDPASRVVKGAYVITHKNVGPDQRQKAREWWEEAQLGGVDLRELMPALDDDYKITVTPPQQ